MSYYRLVFVDPARDPYEGGTVMHVQSDTMSSDEIRAELAAQMPGIEVFVSAIPDSEGRALADAHSQSSGVL